MKKWIWSVALCSVFSWEAYAQTNQDKSQMQCESKGACAQNRVCRGDDFLQGAVAAYNAPAAVQIAGKCCNDSFFATASWIYWYASEDGLDLATTMAFDSGGGTYSPIDTKSGSKTVFQEFDYKSGFKVGLGSRCGGDDWVF